MGTSAINTLLYHIAAYKSKAANADPDKAKRYNQFVKHFQEVVSVLRKSEKIPALTDTNARGGQVSIDDVLGSGNARALDDYIGTTVRCTNCVGSKEIYKDRDLIVYGYDCTLTKDGRVFTLLVGFPDTVFKCGAYISLDEIEVIKDIDETLEMKI